MGEEAATGIARVRQRAQVVRRRALGGVQVFTGRFVERTRPLVALWRRATAVVTPVAWVVALSAGVALYAGLAIGWPELVMGAVFAWALLLIGVPFVLGAHQLASRLDLARDRVVVGERAHGALVLTNTAHRRILPSIVDLPVGHGRASFELPSLAAGEEHEELFAIPTARRAVLAVGPVTSVRADPLGLLRRQQDLTERDVLYVHPRTVRVESSAAGLIRDLEGNSVRTITESDVAFHALRDYVPGDDRRHIHWKTSARSGRLMVRQFEETRRSHLLLLISTRVEDYADDEELELAVSVAGSLGVRVLAEGQTLSSVTSAEPLRARTSRQFLDRLAGVGYTPGGAPLSQAARTLRPEQSAASVAVLFGGSIAETAEFRRARRHLPAEMRVLAVRAAPAEPAVVRSLGDLTLITVPSLDELSPLVRRAAL